MSVHHPWSAWYWNDWDAATAHLNHVQYSIYHRLLKHYYRTQKPLVANASDLARVCLAIGEAEQGDMQEVLRQFFELKPDGYHNERADEEISRAIKISNERAKAGSAGGKRKASNSQAIAKQKPIQSQSHIKPPIIPLSKHCSKCGGTGVLHQMPHVPGPRLIPCNQCQTKAVAN